MITIAKLLKQVTGSGIILWAIIICSILSITFFAIFKYNRQRKSILYYFLGLIINLEVCDIIWLSYLFPNGDYFNRGIIGGLIFLIFPLFLVILNVVLTVINKRKI